MISSIVILFLVSILSGMAVVLLPNFDTARFKVVLAFSGAYLFSLTVIHLLPEILRESDDFRLVGIFVLAGFFLQMVLEYFTTGVEHGHIHLHEHDHHVDHIPYSMFVSLWLHAFLEGSLLFHPSHQHHHHDHDVQTLLFGLVLHKVPESFALMSVLVFGMGKKIKAFVLLLFFAAASPLGLLVSDFVYHMALVSEEAFHYLFSIIAGNFLYISTTIFFESSPNHKFKLNRLIVSLLGAVSAILAEFLL